MTEDLLQEWSTRLVFPREPFLVTEADRSLLPPGAVVHSWAELRDTHGSAPLELWDAYGLYGVRRAETQVALISGAELRSLPAEAQRTLRFRQWERGRTQIYRPEVAPDDPVETPDGLRHMLHHDTWTRLSRAEQQRILLAFAAEGNEPGIPCRGDDPGGPSPCQYLCRTQRPELLCHGPGGRDPIGGNRRFHRRPVAAP